MTSTPKAARQGSNSPPALERYDWLLVNSSGGKDSQAMLDYLVELADAQAFPRGRIVVVHADLGRVEWRGTRELAQAQAEHYGLRFETVSRPQGDLLDHVRTRRMWPSSKARYCTSDHKRGQVAKLVTALVRERSTLMRPVRVLNCLGLRAEESHARAKREPFQRDRRLSNGKRTVDVWLPIHDWTEPQVWERIRQSGVPHHVAYDLGMPRLSCVFCIFASRASLVLAGKHNPELLAEYVQVEREIGHTFRPDCSMRSVQESVAEGVPE